MDRQALLAHQAAIKFQESLSDEIDINSLRLIKSLEHEADRITRQIAEKLNKTFITPIDRDHHGCAYSFGAFFKGCGTFAGRLANSLGHFDLPFGHGGGHCAWWMAYCEDNGG